MQNIDEDFACIVRGCAGSASQERLLGCCQRLDLHIQALRSLCHRLYRENNEALCDAACESLGLFETHDSDLSTELTFKRALLLMAMHLEPEVATHFCSHGTEATRSGVRRLTSSILPKTVRTFITGLCQHPQTFCNQTLLLYELWDDQGDFEAFVDDSVVLGDNAEEEDASQSIDGLALFPSLQAVDPSLHMDPTLIDVMDVRDIVAPSDDEAS